MLQAACVILKRISSALWALCVGVRELVGESSCVVVSSWLGSWDENCGCMLNLCASPPGAEGLQFRRCRVAWRPRLGVSDLALWYFSIVRVLIAINSHLAGVLFPLIRTCHAHL